MPQEAAQLPSPILRKTEGQRGEETRLSPHSSSVVVPAESPHGCWAANSLTPPGPKSSAHVP